MTRDQPLREDFWCMCSFDLGRAELDSNEPVVAGSYTSRMLTYTSGHPIDDSGYVKVVFRHVADFGTPQFTNPSEPNYCTIETTGDCRIVPRWDSKGHTRPWSQALYLQIRFGYLDGGECIRIIFGDRSQGSPGWRMQTFCEETFEFKVFVDPIATYVFKELPQSLELNIVPGEPDRAVCIAPSQVISGESFTYSLKVEDRWGNPTGSAQRLMHSGIGSPGIDYVRATDEETGLSAVSNPINVVDKALSHARYWADFHGQSEETIGINSIDYYFRFAREFGCLDICGHQGNDFQVTDAFWDRINEVADAFYEPGKFVTFPGYEWSGNTPLGGDRNVYFKEGGGSISRSSCELLPGSLSQYPDSRTADELFRTIRRQPVDAFAFAHAGGRYADVRMHDYVEVGMEVHSAWGTFEWLAEDAFRLGYRVGICANSDGHKARPGASYPGAGEFGSYGGLTCVLAERLDREHVYAAMKARHFYATTGNRPLLEVTVSTGEKQRVVMGDVVSSAGGPVVFNVRYTGTGPVDRLEIRNGCDTLETIRPYTEGDLGSRIKVIWSGAEVRGRNRMACWDGMLSLRDNRLTEVKTINFLNPERPLRCENPTELSWRSVTTGGVAGVILRLAEPDAGMLRIETEQCRAKCDVADIGLEPKVWEAGGLAKRLQVYRLPDKQKGNHVRCSIEHTNLHLGDNPLYVCVIQEDGHMAWSSPIYVFVSESQESL